MPAPQLLSAGEVEEETEDTETVQHPASEENSILEEVPATGVDPELDIVPEEDTELEDGAEDTAMTESENEVELVIGSLLEEVYVQLK